MSDKISLREAKAKVKALGFSLTKSGSDYRLAPLGVSPGIAENQAHYTSDLADAIGTAQAEHRRARLKAMPASSTLVH